MAICPLLLTGTLVRGASEDYDGKIAKKLSECLGEKCAWWVSDDHGKTYWEGCVLTRE